MDFNSRLMTFVMLGLILVIAVFARAYKLDSIPPGLWPDEALNGVQAVYEPYHLFYPENQGREGLIMALDAISFKFLGISMFSFRLVPAILGILTVLGVFLLALELFRKKNLALLAAFFVATSFWHINFSRINFRAIMLPLILCYSFYLLFLGMRKKNWWPFFASGAIFGIGFYTYTSFRLAPFILFPVLAMWWLASRKENGQKKFFGQSMLMLWTTFFTALPIGLFFLMGHMADFFGRVGGISVFGQPHPLNAFLESLGRHLIMFNIYGDPNWRHNYSGDPQLFWPVGILFLIGFYLLFRQSIHTIKSRNWYGLLPYALLFIWFFVMLMPGALTYEGMPHALRVIGTVPAVYILAAMGGIGVYDWLKRNVANWMVRVTIVAIFLLFVGIMPVYRYFGQWAENPETIKGFSPDLVAMGNYLKNSPQGYQKFVVMYGGDLPAKTVQLISLTGPGNKNDQFIWPDALAHIETGSQAFVLFMEHNSGDLETLKNRYPGGELKTESKSGAWIYYINK